MRFLREWVGVFEQIPQKCKKKLANSPKVYYIYIQGISKPKVLEVCLPFHNLDSNIKDIL